MVFLERTMLDTQFDLNVDPRIGELAEILAGAVLRLHSCGALDANSNPDAAPKKLPENQQESLEVPGETVLSVLWG